MILTKERLKLAVYAYVRGISASAEVPDVIKDVIVEYAKFTFNWKDSKYLKYSAAYEFSDDPFQITKASARYQWQFLAINDIISRDICKIFRWELKIIKDLDGVFMFGVVQHPVDESIQAWKSSCFGGKSETKSKQFGVALYSWCLSFVRYGGVHVNHNCIGPKQTDKWKEGDRFTLVINFEKKQMSVMYNDKETKSVVVFDNIPDQVVPAICTRNRLQLMCTKYEFE